MCISTLRPDRSFKPIHVKASASVLSTEKSKSSSAKRGRKHREHLIVRHHYHDHMNDPVPNGRGLQASTDKIAPSNSGNVNVPFPIKLYEMLDSVERDGFSHVVSWQPHGRCFVVRKPEEFKDILPRYFKLSKVASFQRQLNLYGFTRLTRGPDKGGYYNELFLRGMPHLVPKIQRVKVKGTGVRAKSNPAEEPDFWSMPWVSTDDKNPSHSAVKSSLTASPAEKVLNGASSVVSHDDQENRSLEEHSCDSQGIISFVELPRTDALKFDQEDDALIYSWGMPFHYLPHDPPAEANSSKPLFTPHRDGVDEDMSKVLGDLDFDTIMRELVDNCNGESFGELLERAIQ